MHSYCSVIHGVFCVSSVTPPGLLAFLCEAAVVLPQAAFSANTLYLCCVSVFNTLESNKTIVVFYC